MFQQWPTLVSIYIDALVKEYSVKWELPEILRTMAVSNETLLDLKQLRSQAMLGMLTFASYEAKTAHAMVHGNVS